MTMFNLKSLLSKSVMMVGFAATALLTSPANAQVLVEPLREGETDRLIMKYHSAPNAAFIKAHMAQVADAAIRHGVTVSYLRSGALDMQVLKLDRALPAMEVQAIADEMTTMDGEIEFVEPDNLVRPAFTPNDSMYSQQWHYYETTGGIRAPAAWDLSRGVGVNVAVIDTGYRPHVDLKSNLLPGYDFVSGNNYGGGRGSDGTDPGDFCFGKDVNVAWHGTHVAGTIAAITNNGVGVAGVAYEAKVVPARVVGTCGTAYASDIADAIVWTSGGTVTGVPTNANPVRVMNMSLGSTGACPTAIQNAINSARSRNSVVVVAAGNNNVNVSSSYPANCGGVIAVTATNRSGGKASYSNFGLGVSIAAPGDNVLSTYNTGLTFAGSDSYAVLSGTSMATPHVVGVVALMLSKKPTLTPDQVLSLLKSSARIFPVSCYQCGAGIVDANAAVTAASKY